MADYHALPSLESLRHRYLYDPDTGAFTWAINSPNGQRFKGDPAGGVSDGHCPRIRIDGRTYKVSRLAWFMATGQDPGALQVDHINGDIYDNRLINLRLATHSQNQANSTTKRAGRLLPKGVYKRGSRYRASINVRGSMLCLGTFATPQEAHAAYMAKAREVWGEYATDRDAPSCYQSIENKSKRPSQMTDSPIRPIPISERLPGPGDCDAEGRCWWFHKGAEWWEPIASPPLEWDEWSHWLPAHALPLPEADG